MYFCSRHMKVHTVYGGRELIKCFNYTLLEVRKGERGKTTMNNFAK